LWSKDFRHDWLTVHDGGNRYWQIKYNLNKSEFTDFNVNGRIQLPIKKDTANSIIIKFNAFMVEGDTSIFNNCCYSSFYLPLEENYEVLINSRPIEIYEKKYSMKSGNSRGDWNAQLNWNDQTKMYETHGWGN